MANHCTIALDLGEGSPLHGIVARPAGTRLYLEVPDALLDKLSRAIDAEVANLKSDLRIANGERRDPPWLQ